MQASSPLLPQGPARTSALLAPTMLLTGHADQVFTARFNPEGDVLATGSFDKTILLYRTYGECENFLHIKGPLLPVPGIARLLAFAFVCARGGEG